MRNIYLLGLVLIFSSCRPDKGLDTLVDFPESDGLLIRWQILDDAFNRDNLRTQVISILNNDSTDIPSHGWTLYYNQLPGSLYLDPSDEVMVRISNQGGDYFMVEPGEAFPGIPAGSSFDIKYKMPLDLIKTSFYPHGYYFTTGNEEEQIIIPVENIEYEPVPESFTYYGERDLSVFISGPERFETNKDIQSYSIDELAPIIPTPKRYERRAGHYQLQSNVKVHYDKGLRSEADFLAGVLNQILQHPIQDTKEICL